MNLTKKNVITVLPGDGIGCEVTHAAVPVFEALNIPCRLNFGKIGWQCWQSKGRVIPDKTWDLILNSDAVLLGATTSMPDYQAQLALPDFLQKQNIQYNSPILELRQKLELYANVRPCHSYINNNETNFTIIRENTEGLYSGLDFFPMPEGLASVIKLDPRWQTINNNSASATIRIQTEKGLKRIYTFAFDYAVKHGLTEIVLADKPNVLRKSCHFAFDIFQQISKQYKSIKTKVLNIDAIAMMLVRNPQQFQLIVCENMFGDILSDLGAGLVGGLGMAPSANVSENFAYFEPVHGSGLSMKANSANPCAMFLSISMLLDYLGYNVESKKIKYAIKRVLNKNQIKTVDLGGSATTTVMAKAIIQECGQ